MPMHSHAPLFFVGLHQPADARWFPRACVSINRLRGRRRRPVGCPEVLLDSGAFTELATYGRYRHSVAEYAAEIRRLHDEGLAEIVAAVAQDYMCEPFILSKTGLTVAEHQRLTIERYDALLVEAPPVPVMPVLQGYDPRDYARHVAAYGDRLAPGMWTGVGSVCKRNGQPGRIVEVLAAIAALRPDLRLHGFGVKSTSLGHPGVRARLHSADSMAWSFAARREGRDANSWLEAAVFVARLAEAGIADVGRWT
jgi:hypothetical protein